MPGPLLVGTHQQQFLHGGTGLQLATQVGERAAAVFVGDEQSSDLLDGVVFVEVADGAG